MSEKKKTVGSPGSRASYVLIAALAAVAGFAAVYGIAPIADNAGEAPAKAAANNATAVIAAGTAAVAAPAERAEAKAGHGKLTAFVHKTDPEPVAEFPFLDGDGQPRTIRDWRGKVVLLNLWATWCWPCREEMPSLARLQKELGSDAFEVVALSVDRTGLKGARDFLDGIKVDSLKVYADPTARAGSQLKIIGMPSTLLIDRHGREIGRLVGPAEWDSPEAKRLIEAALR